jgi:hypothetical protein
LLFVITDVDALAELRTVKAQICQGVATMLLKE